MTPRRLHRRSRRRASATKLERAAALTDAERPTPERGPQLLLERIKGDAQGTEILAALGEHYEISALGEDRRLLQVVVDDAVFPDEAVVRLASVLDGIDQDWVLHIRWPKVQA